MSGNMAAKRYDSAQEAGLPVWQYQTFLAGRMFTKAETSRPNSGRRLVVSIENEPHPFRGAIVIPVSHVKERQRPAATEQYKSPNGL
jgi:hypothetical protein